MSDGGSEEKNLPASKKKLDDARKKGQVAGGKDLVSGATFAAGAGFILVSGATFVALATALFHKAGEAVVRAETAPDRAARFTEALGTMRGAVEAALNGIVLPLFVIVPAAAVLASVVALRGVVFSTEPLTPKPSKISPMEGFKKIFSLRALMEFLKSVLKTALLAAVLIGVLWGGLRPLLLSPSCGVTCEAGVFGALFIPLLAAAALVFILVGVGVGDLGLQRWLFSRDMKMSVTEQKRERKEQDGDPHVKGARRALMKESATAPRGGAATATLILLAPAEGSLPAIAIGVRFVRGETPVPAVVARGEAERVAAIVERAGAAGIPVAREPEVTRALAARARPGGFVPQDLFGDVAGAMVRAGTI